MFLKEVIMNIDELMKYNSPTKDIFILRKLNDGEEAENILVISDTILLGNNRMQIKKLDGTIEKYKIDKYYPVDEKDLRIKELNKKVEELERKLNNEPTSNNESTKELDKSNANDDGDVKPESKTSDESISNNE